MKKKWSLCSYLMLLVAGIFFYRGMYLLGGVALLLVGVLGIVDRWNKTHEIVYVVSSTSIFIFTLLLMVWLIPKGIVTVGWICIPLVGLIVLEIFYKTKD